MEIAELAQLAETLTGVRRTTANGLAQWRYHGRLVARQLDHSHLVIRADFDYRHSILRQFPETFSVPTRFVKHMMVVADLANGDAEPSRTHLNQPGTSSGALTNRRAAYGSRTN
jgi:hypothetical protein